MHKSKLRKPRTLKRATPRNEVTGKKPASVAGRVLRRLKEIKATPDTMLFLDAPGTLRRVSVCTVGELKAMAGTSLTQAPDKKNSKKGRT